MCRPDQVDTKIHVTGRYAVNAVMKDANAANDGYYLTPEKARNRRRIASVKAKNGANARIFIVGGVPMTVKQIATQINSTSGQVSKEIKKLRKQGVCKFTFDQFTHKAANDDPGAQHESNRVPPTDSSAG